MVLFVSLLAAAAYLSALKGSEQKGREGLGSWGQGGCIFPSWVTALIEYMKEEVQENATIL